MADLTPQILDRRWGEDFHERLDILQHSTRLAGGNPCVIFRHGGGASAGDKRYPWVHNNTGNPLATYLNQLSAPGITPFDVISVGTPQASWGSPISAPHLGSTFDEPITTSGIFPRSFKSAQRVVAWVKQHAEELGLSGECILYGGSFGAQLWLATQAWPPLVVTRSAAQQLGRYEARRADSRALGIINEAGQIDYRNLEGVDQILWTWGDDIVGAYTQTEWDALPVGMKEAISVMAFLDKGDHRWIPPILSVYEVRGNHVKPYANPHDDSQLDTLHAALGVAGIPNVPMRIAIDQWIDPVLGPQLSQAVYAWMVSLLQPS
jgi:hypothetical protein